MYRVFFIVVSKFGVRNRNFSLNFTVEHTPLHLINTGAHSPSIPCLDSRKVRDSQFWTQQDCRSCWISTSMSLGCTFSTVCYEFVPLWNFEGICSNICSSIYEYKYYGRCFSVCWRSYLLLCCMWMLWKYLFVLEG